MIQGFLITVMVLVAVFFALLGLALASYAAIALRLPSPAELANRELTFETTKIYDRQGELLYEALDPHGGRRTRVKLAEISPYLIQATVATEDRHFYQHPGVDPWSILRAIVQNIRERDVVSGGSTIPQQLVKMTFFGPEKTLSRKVQEAVLAAEISRQWSKNEILELYLNQLYYGNLAYGIEAAAETYFGKRAADLTLPEAALLAGLPQAPALYDPFMNPDGAKARQRVVLDLMVEAGYLTPAQADTAFATPLQFRPAAVGKGLRAPHFVMYVRQLLEEQYGPQAVYGGGLQVTTTLDPRLQTLAEEIARKHVAALRDRNVTNAALVALKPETGEILAMIGSVDFFDPAISGQVNVALRPRQPGSVIKPVTYLAAFEKGWTPATAIMDVTTEFPDGANPPYKPVNYDGQEHGMVTVRTALANSLNIPAVKTLQEVGLPAMLEMAHRLGIASLNRPDYGLSLTLGGGEVTLLEMTGAYAVLANGGQRVPPTAILDVRTGDGRVLYRYKPVGEQVISPQHAYLITHILADNEARHLAFGPHSVLELSRPAAVKTGTTNDWRDNWTIGYTPELVTGVWVGNSDNSPMADVTGVAGAGPIWHDFMEGALAGTPVRDFIRPEGIVEYEVCAISGARPSPSCPTRRIELFAAGTQPLDESHDIHQRIRIDRTTGALATEWCPDNVVEEHEFEVYPPEYREWAETHGHPQPPRESCPVHTGPARAQIMQPAEGESVQGIVTIIGQAVIPDFARYVVEYGVGWDPGGWGTIAVQEDEPVDGGILAQWDTSGLYNMEHTLRLVVFDHWGNVVEARRHIWVNNPLPTASPTPWPTETVTPTPLPTETDTPTPWPTLTETPWSPSPTGWPTETPTPTATEPLPEPTLTSTEIVVLPTDTPTPAEPLFTETPIPTATEWLETATPTTTAD